jgi:hypothetical protein
LTPDRSVGKVAPVPDRSVGLETNPTRAPERPIPDPSSSRDKIIDVAQSLLARRGYAGIGLREVAEA